jgi:hypothetical protein
MSGSDSGTAWAWWSYVAATALVVFLTGYRVVTGAGAARERAARPAPAPRSAPGPGPGLRPAPALAPLDFRAPHHGPPPTPRDEARPDR